MVRTSNVGGYFTSPPSFLCSSQEPSRRASARRKESIQPKDLGWLDLCDEHRDEGGVAACRPKLRLDLPIPAPPTSPRD
ncbi:hypothetical protein CO657_10645 [Rhizobium acidisoli]|uniref:Uncharacterized protein n=1 Tax=Rhizobium acidisoli TaxID=1538158 RepID=A0AAE5WPR8_9HYPH|nr:hypothetical protein CO657_10645 [Rhizobium acidisoli]